MNIKAFYSRVTRKLKSIMGSPFNYFRGRRSVEYVLNTKEENELCIICTPLIGDTVYSLSCLDAIKHKTPDKMIHVYSYQKFSKLLDEYKTIDNITYIDQPGNEVLLGLDMFLHFDGLCEWAKSQGVVSANPFYYKKCYNAENPDCLFQMQTHIFGVSQESKITYHRECGDDCRREKVAILNPYSYSTFEASFNVYEEITDELNKKGYAVYTNVIKDQKPVKGSQELRCTIEELFELACKSDMIISARSGILDYLAPSDINMFVIYENCSERLRNMYHLDNWKRYGLVKEVYPGISDYSYQDINKDFLAFLSAIEKRG